MWVLEARYKAEKVWYSFIWEKAKEDPNVIDYNINEEITKDTSWVINANNQTTTGMATVIPWVNAPKLIAKTSTYWIDFNAWFQWGVQFRFYQHDSWFVTVPAWESMTFWIDRMTNKRNQTWPYDFQYMQWRWIVIPSTWTYSVTLLFSRVGDWWWVTSLWEALLNWEVVFSKTTGDWETTETFKIYPYQYDSLTFRVTFDNTSSLDKKCSYILWATLNKS
jgi:hypothetical protein